MTRDRDLARQAARESNPDGLLSRAEMAEIRRELRDQLGLPMAVARIRALEARLSQVLESSHRPHEQPSAEATPTGAALLKAHFSGAELDRIDAARGAESQGLWLRRIVIRAITSGEPLAEVPRIAGPARTVNFRAGAKLVELLDRARGIAARNTYIRAAALAAL